jgi:cytochrome bd ubiquinol oxidase subunit II
VNLPEIFFFVIAFVWSVFVFLEGFDFGVGMLTRAIGRTDRERRTMLRAIGPNWDANEVWLLTGGILIFAAFPAWYAAAFPSAYIPLLLVVFSLIIRALAIEYRSKRPDHRWTQAWDNANLVVGFLLPFLIGVFWAGMVYGIPIDADGRFVGDSLWSHISVYSVLGGLALVSYSLAHGAVFLSLKVTPDLEPRTRAVAGTMSVVTLVLMAAFATWTWLSYSDDTLGLVMAVITIVTFAAAAVSTFAQRSLAAFWWNGIGALAFMFTIFIALFPNVLPSTIDDGYTLTIENAAAGSYALTVLAVIAVIGIPGVMAYQAWSFWVFRKRLTRETVDAGHY